MEKKRILTMLTLSSLNLPLSSSPLQLSRELLLQLSFLILKHMVVGKLSLFLGM